MFNFAPKVSFLSNFRADDGTLGTRNFLKDDNV